MRALVTGAGGFLGKHLTYALRASGVQVDGFLRGDPPSRLEALCRTADVVYHLAGVNRAEDAREFERGNVQTAIELTKTLRRVGNACPVVVSSSVQATLPTPYGVSKRESERIFLQYGQESGASVRLLRLPGVFGKWCRPHYNSVVATFCHDASRSLPLCVHEPQRELELLYVDDAIRAMIDAAGQHGVGYGELPEPYRICVGALAAQIEDFCALQAVAVLPTLAPDSLQARLYATYLSYLPPSALCVALQPHADERGSFCELLRSTAGGQVSVNVTLPGHWRGGHWHGSKWEMFFVVSGQGEVLLRRVGSDEELRFAVSGEQPCAVRIPPGYVHRLINRSDGALTTVIWADEYFDAQRPDTYKEE